MAKLVHTQSFQDYGNPEEDERMHCCNENVTFTGPKRPPAHELHTPPMQRCSNAWVQKPAAA